MSTTAYKLLDDIPIGRERGEQWMIYDCFVSADPHGMFARNPAGVLRWQLVEIRKQEKWTRKREKGHSLLYLLGVFHRFLHCDLMHIDLRP